MAIALNNTATVVLDTLTRRVRTATEEQLQRILSACCPRPIAIRSVLKRLTLAGLLRGRRVSVAFPEPSQPLVVWHPRQPTPDFHALAYHLEKRWRSVTPYRTSVWWAMPNAAKLFGGTACFPRHATQFEHDLGTAGILITLYETNPEAAWHWIGEDVLRRDYAPADRRLTKMPDAAIVRDGELVQFIEYGGQYCPQRLRRQHEHCRKYGLPYALW